MSTRSQIIIKDAYNEQWFYRHSDGYPSGNMPQLYKFMNWLDEGKIRNNVEQSCGWLVLIGAREYDHKYKYDEKKNFVQVKKDDITEPEKEDGWKYGAYEICPCRRQHSDIEWLYEIDLTNNSIAVTDIRSNVRRLFQYKGLKKYASDWEAFEWLWE